MPEHTEDEVGKVTRDPNRLLRILASLKNKESH